MRCKNHTAHPSGWAAFVTTGRMEAVVVGGGPAVWWCLWYRLSRRCSVALFARRPMSLPTALCPVRGAVRPGPSGLGSSAGSSAEGRRTRARASGADATARRHRLSTRCHAQCARPLVGRPGTRECPCGGSPVVPRGRGTSCGGGPALSLPCDGRAVGSGAKSPFTRPFGPLADLLAWKIWSCQSPGRAVSGTSGNPSQIGLAGPRSSFRAAARDLALRSPRRRSGISKKRRGSRVPCVPPAPVQGCFLLASIRATKEGSRAKLSC